MSSTALALVPSDVSPFINYPTQTSVDKTYSGHEKIEEMMRLFQSSTGKSQTEERELLTPWFFDYWAKALVDYTETSWQFFPEDVFDSVDERKDTLKSSDARYLGNIAVDSDIPTTAAVAAIRLLGILAEDGYLEKTDVLPHLRDALTHEDAQRRYYGAKAIWQAKAREGVVALKKRLARETSKRVKSVIERAINVLE